MTAEEYLNEHCKPEDWNNLEECLKDSILTNNVIEHMERYAALRIHDVVGRSEQLKCEHNGRRKATELVEYCEDCKNILFHP